MAISIQTAPFWKRISAYLLDAILAIIITIGVAALLSAALGYDKHVNKYQACKAEYEASYGVDLDISEEEYTKLSEDEKQVFLDCQKAFMSDVKAQKEVSLMFQIILVITSLSFLVSILVIYFALPLFFKNGQTLGKKVFGVAVMRSSCVKISTPILFIRSILGMYTIETMFPILLFVMIYFNLLGGVGTITIGLFFVLQICVTLFTQMHTSIHDLLSDTLVVDFATQQIFDTPEDLLAYKQKLHEESVANAERG